MMQQTGTHPAIEQDSADVLAPTPLPTTIQVQSPKQEQSADDSVPSKDEGSASNEADKQDQSKRFIPEHKKPDAALTFPEKLMSLMKLAQKEDPETFCVAWLADGNSFVIRNPDEFTRKVLPKFFKATKFSSFTRKLYRWGFRQVNRGIGPDDPIIFGNDSFQRDELELMTQMRSTTAASTRKQEHSTMQLFAQKRALDTMSSEQNKKRALIDRFMQHNSAMNSGMFQNGGMNLAQALRPSNNGFNGFGGMKAFDMLSQQMNTGNPLMNPFQQGSFNTLGSSNQHQQPFSNTASTADIVNAAIHALRYAP